VLFRILHVRVKPDKLDEWLRYTRDEGFPGMLRQHGCRQIWRLRTHDSEADYHIMTLWDRLEDLQRFRESDDMRRFTAASAAVMDPARGETLYDVIEDPSE
jgi:heme-degrading monooxygenase HmoA